MKVSKELADVLRDARAEVDKWPDWKRSLDPIGNTPADWNGTESGYPEDRINDKNAA